MRGWKGHPSSGFKFSSASKVRICERGEEAAAIERSICMPTLFLSPIHTGARCTSARSREAPSIYFNGASGILEYLLLGTYRMAPATVSGSRDT